MYSNLLPSNHLNLQPPSGKFSLKINRADASAIVFHSQANQTLTVAYRAPWIGTWLTVLPFQLQTLWGRKTILSIINWFICITLLGKKHWTQKQREENYRKRAKCAHLSNELYDSICLLFRLTKVGWKYYFIVHGLKSDPLHAMGREEFCLIITKSHWDPILVNKHILKISFWISELHTNLFTRTYVI